MKRRMFDKKVMRECFLTAGIAGIVFILFSVLCEITPFGEFSIIRNDAIHQYVPFLVDYANKIKSGSSLLFSWNIGGGVNEYALIAYYLLSPFNFVALLFNEKNIDVAFWTIILLKTMCISASSSYFFKKKFQCKDLIAVAFSLIYTFSGFYICYYYNTMWLDALIALPLIALGLENIVNGKKATLYFISLTYAIFVNFYMGYMLCIFSVAYFIYLIFAKDITDKDGKREELPIMKVMFKFGSASLFSGLCCAAIILPVFFAINYGTSKSNFELTDAFFNFFDFISYHLTGVTVKAIEYTEDTAPYLMSSMLVVILFPLFFFSKEIKPNKKVATLVLLAIFYFSFAIPKMNFFWHGLSAPANLPYRFSYIYLFIIINIAIEVLLKLKSVPKYAYICSLVLAITAITYSYFTSFSDHFNNKTTIVSACALVVYFILVFGYEKEKFSKKLISSLIVVTFIVELIVGNYVNFNTRIKKSDSYKYDNVIPKVNSLINEDGFYRMEILEEKKTVENKPALYSFNGISEFSSLSDGDFSATQEMLGNNGNMTNSYSYAVQTPIYNSLFSLNYIYDTSNAIEENKYNSLAASDDDGTLYKVNYVLPLGYCVREDIKAWTPYSYLTTQVQSSLWKYATGISGVMDFAKPADIEYVNCNEVTAEEIKQYVIDNVSNKDSNYNEDHDEHDHNHEEDLDEGYKSSLDSNENVIVSEFNLTAENLSQIVDAIGDVYPFKAVSEDFKVVFNYTANENGEVFALANSGSMQTLKVIHEDGTEKEIDITDRHLSDLGYFTKGEKYTLIVSNPDRPLSEYDAEYPLSDSIQMSVASINEEKFLEGYNQILKNGTLQVDEFDDTYIHGTVNATIDGMMMMPMPYDEGWSVYVDGEQVELFEHESHIMMFELSKGEHEIEMSYFPLGLKEGMFVSFAAVLGIVMVLLLSKVHKMKEQFIAEEEKKETDEKGKE